MTGFNVFKNEMPNSYFDCGFSAVGFYLPHSFRLKLCFLFIFKITFRKTKLHRANPEKKW